MKQVSALIRITRLKKGVKAAALAHECNITASYLSQIESGKEVDPTLTSMILDHLGLRIRVNNKQIQNLDVFMDKMIHTAALYDLPAVNEQLSQLVQSESVMMESELALKYLLVMFIAHTLNKNNTELRALREILKKCIKLFTPEQVQLYYLYLGMSFADSRGDLFRDYTLKVLSMKETENVTSIAYYHLAVICARKNNHFLADKYNLKAQRAFLDEQNYLRLIFSKSFEAVLYSENGMAEEALEISCSILDQTTLQLSEFQRSQVLQNILFTCILAEQYQKVSLYCTQYQATVKLTDFHLALQAFALYKQGQPQEAASLIELCQYDENDPFTSQFILIVRSMLAQDEVLLQRQLIQAQKFSLKIGDDLSAKFITELLCAAYIRKNNYAKAIYYQNLLERKK